MAVTRRAEVQWKGKLAGGEGKVSLVSSGVVREAPVSWPARTESPGGKTSPEELVAAAHASCFSMALSAQLAKAGADPELLEVACTVTFDKVGDGWRVTRSALEVRGRVKGIDADGFERAARGAKEGCPISQALKGNVDLEVSASLAT